MSQRQTIALEHHGAQLTLRLVKDYDAGKLLPAERAVLEEIMVRYFATLESESNPRESADTEYHDRSGMTRYSGLPSARKQT